MRRWDVQFYIVLFAVTLFVLGGASLLGMDYALSAFLGATVVSFNFAILIVLGRYFFRTPDKKFVPALLLIAHVFIAPGLLYILIRFMDINILAVLLGALVSATISPMAMAVIGLAHANDDKTLSLAAVCSGNGEEGR